MTKFIEMELKDERLIAINIDQVVAFKQIGEYTDIHLVTGDKHTVKMDYNKFMAEVRREIAPQP